MWIDNSTNKPDPLETVDIYVLGVGRIPDCQWSRGRQAWVKEVPHGLIEYNINPSHWRRIPDSPAKEKKETTPS